MNLDIANGYSFCQRSRTVCLVQIHNSGIRLFLHYLFLFMLSQIDSQVFLEHLNVFKTNHTEQRHKRNSLCRIRTATSTSSHLQERPSSAVCLALVFTNRGAAIGMSSPEGQHPAAHNNLLRLRGHRHALPAVGEAPRRAGGTVAARGGHSQGRMPPLSAVGVQLSHWLSI